VISRGHIHKILTNPLYIGRIAHKGTSFEGQHPAIIEMAQWERVQATLTEQSGISRGQRNSGRPTSPLAGKLFDISGERLTPVHTQKAGRRYAYYISQGLKIAAAPGQQSSGWRLPARALEDRIVAAVRKHLRTAILRGLVPDADTHLISDMISKIDHSDFDILAVIDRVRIGRDSLEVSVDPDRLSKAFGVPAVVADADQLTIKTPFTLRRRGVEAKLLLEGDAIPCDETLLRNIAKGHAFLDMITSGQTVPEIAEAHNLSVRRVQQTLEFAFLSPDATRQIVEGCQPASLTADWCLKHEISADWAEQALQFSTL
jgi:site-specific DNA recombinase